MKTKLNTKTIVAAVASVIGLAVYGYTSMVGYLAASATSTLPVVLTVAALVCLALRQFAGSKLPAVVNDVLLVAANVCLIGSFAVFVLARVSLAADVYFIPVNYPPLRPRPCTSPSWVPCATWSHRDPDRGRLLRKELMNPPAAGGEALPGGILGSGPYLVIK